MSATIGAGTTGRNHALAARDEAHAVTSGAVAKALAGLRIVIGLTFLWAFVDKLFGLGYSTPSNGSWLNGGSPTEGFLAHGAKGPFEGFYHALAGQWWVDTLFMLGLLAVGVALTFGIGMRIGSLIGVILYVMMWTVALPPANNPVLDEHIIGAFAVAVVGLALAGDTFGFGKVWGALDIVKRYPVLR